MGCVENFKRWEPTAVAKKEDNIGTEPQKVGLNMTSRT